MASVGDESFSLGGVVGVDVTKFERRAGDEGSLAVFNFILSGVTRAIACEGTIEDERLNSRRGTISSSPDKRGIYEVLNFRLPRSCTSEADALGSFSEDVGSKGELREAAVSKRASGTIEGEARRA